MAKTTSIPPLGHYLNLRYPITLLQEPEGGYSAEIRNLPGCVAQGETIEEALAAIEEAQRLWLQVAHEHGDEIPLPETEETHSGRLLLRLPRSLHRRLAEDAEREGVSLNQHLVALLSERGALQRVREAIAQLRPGRPKA